MTSGGLRQLCQQLIVEGRERLSRPPRFMEFARILEADKLLNNLDEYPHAFVIACIMDRQMSAEKAWRIPYNLREAVGCFDFATLAGLTESYLRQVMSGPPALHRFPETMAKNLYSALRRIEAQYGGDASMIWVGRHSSATIVRRFLEFDGVGQKIATMAANILVRDFRIPVSDRYSIDMSVDVQVRRVFTRMGFVPDNASAELAP